jgi:hypothetical protein
MTHDRKRGRMRRVLPVVVACGLLAGGCATRDVHTMNGGPPTGPSWRPGPST